MMRDSRQLREALIAETLDLQLMRAALPMRQLVSLLDILIESHMVDLATVDPARLLFVQGAVRQLQCLRATLLDDNPHLSPKA